MDEPRPRDASSPAPAHRAVVWLDRDGTIVDDPGYLNDPSQLHLLPGAAEAIAALNRAGATVVLVTNQSGIARGLMSAETVDRIHRRLQALLAEAGARLDAIYLCPDLPDELRPSESPRSSCRKPHPGMIERARRELGIGAIPQIVVGDKIDDLGLARNCGCPAVLVLTGEGRKTAAGLQASGELEQLAAHVADDLRAALPWLITELGLASDRPSC